MNILGITSILLDAQAGAEAASAGASTIWNFILALIVSVPIAWWFMRKQRGFHSETMSNLKIYKDFFEKNDRYYTCDDVNNTEANKSSKVLVNVSVNNEFSDLINDINDYLRSCRGTATFSIIQNKTERRLTKLYDKTCSKSSFPTHYGLMGTFVGVFIGLIAFLVGSWIEGDITDASIHSLILGVLVSMITSAYGLYLSTNANNQISDAKNQIDDDKNEFYEFIQNRLMPSVDISLTEALGNLHQTVSDFQPAFSGVIAGFKKTFQDCTDAFGEDFRKSVTTMVNAVGIMSNNVNTITDNVTLLKSLLNKLSGAEWVNYMRQFAAASEHFEELTHSLNDFERARRLMLGAIQEAINLQKSYNDSLEIPNQVARSINGILQRVVTFEESINALGTDIAQTQMISNTTIEEIQAQIKAIKQKHKIAEKFVDTGNERLEKFFEEEVRKLGRLQNKYFDALDKLFKHYSDLIEKHEKEIGQRHQIFIEAIDEKFELSEVRGELGNLNKIPGIAAKVEEVKTGQEKLQKASQGIRSKLEEMKLEDKDKKDKDKKKGNKEKEENKEKSVKGNKHDNKQAKNKDKGKEKDEVDEMMEKVMEEAERNKKIDEQNKKLLEENNNSGEEIETSPDNQTGDTKNEDGKKNKKKKKKSIWSWFGID